MAGICAVLSPNAERLIKLVCKSLRHRGPDDEGFFIDKNLALGHRELKINSGPVPHQPLANEKGNIWITFDGEIYNKGQLLQKLKANHVFKTNSSAEIVIHAYEDYGFNCLSEFNGMFAFALWDSKNGWIFSARDRVGIKPLYYNSNRGQFILASEIKGILADPSVLRKPNERLIFEYLVTGYPNKVEDTFFVGIKELKPANYMIVDKSGIDVREYWRPNQSLKPDFPIENENMCASEFYRLIRDSISIRLQETVPIGTFLSGGLDSTSIAFLVDNILESNHSINGRASSQKVYSAIYRSQTEQGDERSYIKEVARALKKDINYVFPSVIGEWNSIKKFIYYIDEPVAVFNYYVFWYLFQAAKQEVKIIFSGQGSDATLGGQTEHVLVYFKELWKEKKIGTLIREVVKSLDWISPMLIWSIFFSHKAESKAEMLLAPTFVATYKQSATEKGDISLQRALVNDVTQHAIEYLRVDDRASSVFSIECRHPFLDHRIIEFAFLLPPNQKIKDGWTKYVARNAMKDVIPETIRKKRKKLGTPIPQQRWMKELRGEIKNLFESNKFRERGYFNQRAVIEMFDRYCEGKLSRLERHYYANVLWRILNLELWLESFIDPNNKINSQAHENRN